MANTVDASASVLSKATGAMQCNSKISRGSFGRPMHIPAQLRKCVKTKMTPEACPSIWVCSEYFTWRSTNQGSRILKEKLSMLVDVIFFILRQTHC